MGSSSNRLLERQHSADIQKEQNSSNVFLYLHHPALEEKTTCWTAVQIFFDVYTVLHIGLWIIYLNGKYDCSKQTCVYMYIYTYVYVCVDVYMYMLESVNRPPRTHLWWSFFFCSR